MIVPWGFQPKGSCLPDLSSTAKRATAYATLGLFQIVAPPNGSSTEQSWVSTEKVLTCWIKPFSLCWSYPKVVLEQIGHPVVQCPAGRCLVMVPNLKGKIQKFTSKPTCTSQLWETMPLKPILSNNQTQALVHGMFQIMKLCKKLNELAHGCRQSPLAPTPSRLFSTPPRERRTIYFVDVIGLPIFLKRWQISFITTTRLTPQTHLQQHPKVNQKR